MKFKVLFLTLLLFTALLAGCGKKNDTTGQTTDNTKSVDTSTTDTSTTDTSTGTTDTSNTTDTTDTTSTTDTTDTTTGDTVDVVTTASIVDTEDAFMKAISKDGTWIIAILKDMSINKDLTLDGEFKNGKKDDKGKDIIQRKLAFYSQDENRKITARYTLTAPKLTINSPMASIQHGTFKGDVYVSANNFELIDATVDGNLYFDSNDIKSTFKMDKDSKVTGKQEIKK
jgi:hypothetical protein